MNEEDLFKNEGWHKSGHNIFPIISLWGFFQALKGSKITVQGPIWLNYERIRDFMGVLVACKNEEDQIKNEGARVVTTLFIDFSETQGQLTPKSVMESC